MTNILTRAICYFNRAVLLVLYLSGQGLFAIQPDEWFLAVEPAFLVGAGNRTPIEGSARTVLTIMKARDGEMLPLDKSEEALVRRARSSILVLATKNADRIFSGLGLKPKFIRDRKKVIQYALVESESPFTASLVLQPGFADMFRDTLGPDLLVAMPTRYQVLVFSKQDDAHLRLSEEIIGAYLSSNQPVSREIFSIGKDGLRSIGYLE